MLGMNIVYVFMAEEGISKKRLTKSILSDTIVSMDMKKTHIVLKDLLSLGYKKNSISKLMNQAEVFKNIVRHHGYAIPYTYEEAFLICLGCELFNMGLSFRHVDIVLLQIDKKKIAKNVLSDFLVIFGHPENIQLEVKEIIGDKIVTHDVLYKVNERKVRTTALLAKEMSQRDLVDMVQVSREKHGMTGSFIVTDLNEIKSMVDSLFK